MAISLLPVNFIDDILASSNPKRKYDLTENQDGSISLDDVTLYSQTGSNFGAGEHNATNGKVNEIINLINNGDIGGVDPRRVAHRDFYLPSQEFVSLIDIDKEFNYDLDIPHIIGSSFDSHKVYDVRFDCAVDINTSASVLGCVGYLRGNVYISTGSQGGGLFLLQQDMYFPITVIGQNNILIPLHASGMIDYPFGLDIDFTASKIYDSSGAVLSSITGKFATYCALNVYAYD